MKANRLYSSGYFFDQEHTLLINAVLLRFTLLLIFVQKEGATSRSPGHGSLIHSALFL